MVDARWLALPGVGANRIAGGSHKVAGTGRTGADRIRADAARDHVAAARTGDDVAALKYPSPSGDISCTQSDGLRVHARIFRRMFASEQSGFERRGMILFFQK
jgi:hypothetical protein